MEFASQNGLCAIALMGVNPILFILTGGFMGLRALALATYLLFAPFAFAQEDSPSGTRPSAGYSNSEYMHQAPGGKFELTPGMLFESVRYEFKSNTNEPTIFRLPLFVKAEYGFSDMFSLSAVLAYAVGGTSYTECTTTCPDSKKSSGLMDPIVSANLRFPIGAGALRAGLDFSFSTEDSKTESDGDYNNASGGSTLAPYVGYEITFGRNILGGRLSHELVKSDRTHKDQRGTPSTEKISGGQDTFVNVFYEFNFPRIVSLGAAIEHQKSPTTKSSTNGGPKTSDKNELSITKFKFYVPLEFNERVTLVPALAVGPYRYKNATSLESATYTSVGVYSRFTF